MLPKMPLNVNFHGESHTSMNATATTSRLSTNPRLTDNDTRAVDFLLDVDSSACNELASPMSSGSFMERVQSAQRLLCLLDNLPGEEPPANLAEATLQKILPTTDDPVSVSGSGIHA